MPASFFRVRLVRAMGCCRARRAAGRPELIAWGLLLCAWDCVGHGLLRRLHGFPNCLLSLVQAYLEAVSMVSVQRLDLPESWSALAGAILAAVYCWTLQAV